MYEIHKAVGNILLELRDSITGLEVMLDTTCGGSHTVPLYGLDSGDGSDHLVEVDAAIILGNEIKVVVEIDKSDLRPVALCGKVLGTAISTHYRLGNTVIGLSESMLFIQVLEKSAANLDTPKARQCKYLEREIGRFLSAANNRVKKYSFHYGMPEEFAAEASHGEALRNEITSFLNAPSPVIS
jgi:hypothetical protein